MDYFSNLWFDFDYRDAVEVNMIFRVLLSLGLVWYLELWDFALGLIWNNLLI